MALTITSIDPTFGGQGANAKHLTVTGTDFSSSATVEILKDGLTGVSVNSVAFVDSTNLDIEIRIEGNADVGVYDVLVTNPDTSYYRLSDAFTVITGPKLSSLSPDSLAQGTSSTVVTINGTGFQAGASIFILNSTADGFATDIVLEDAVTFVSSTVLTVPLHVASDAVVSGRLVVVENPDSGFDFISPGFTVTAEGGGGDPVWTNLSIGAFKVGRSYDSTVHASGFPAPTYSVTGGVLPDGISLNSSTGQLSGTPTTEGEYTFTITASN